MKEQINFLKINFSFTNNERTAKAQIKLMQALTAGKVTKIIINSYK
jgi:hypothetical protein